MAETKPLVENLPWYVDETDGPTCIRDCKGNATIIDIGHHDAHAICVAVNGWDRLIAACEAEIIRLTKDVLPYCANQVVRAGINQTIDQLTAALETTK